MNIKFSSLQKRLIAACLVLSALASNNYLRANIVASLYNPGFLEGDCNYHSITPASNGRIYFTIGTHHPKHSARLYVFDPKTEQIRELLKVNEALGEDAHASIPHGKVHTPLIEADGFLYFTTHTSGYDGNLPDRQPQEGRQPYPGGCFVRFDLKTEQLDKLAQIPLSSEGLITFAMDKANGLLYGLTWPSGLIFQYSLESQELLQFGATQGRGEWGQLGEDWSFICRSLAQHPDGTVYGSTDSGHIWKFNPANQRPIQILDDLSLNTVPAIQEKDFVINDEPHFYWRNWRSILWNANTKSFWGLHGGSTQLFEFSPDKQVLRSVANMRVQTDQLRQRNPYRTQLGLTLSSDNTLYYIAHGPALSRPGRRDTKANAYLLSYNIDTGKRINHGPLLGPGDERIFFSESLAIGPHGNLWSVAWVEVLDPHRAEQVQQARGNALPAETRDVIYEMQLIRIPPPTTRK